jgi:hypothetical protein
MKPFAVKGLGDAYLRLPNPPTFRWLMRHQGVADLRKIAELDAYLVLLRRTDSDLCLLEIMRGSRQQQGPWTKQGGYAGVAVGSAPIWFISVNTSQYCVISTMRPSWTRIRSHAANFTGRPVPLRPANSPWCVPL